MSYLGNNPTYGDTTSNFKLLDDISTYTLTFDGSSSAVVSTSNYTITQISHRFITGQRVTYTNGGGGSIGGLTSGTAYYIIKNDQNTIKLATSLVNANNNNPISLTSLGTGTSHTLNVAFDSINTKFKATYDNGIKAFFTAAAQLQISINGVIQQPQNTTTPVNGFGFDVDAVVIFSTAPAVSDIFWGNIIANNFAAYDIADNVVDNFTGNASQLNFNLSRNVPNSQSLLVTIDGVVQYPSDETTSRAYSVYNNELRFTSAPGSGTVIQARHIGFAGAVTSNVTGFYGRTGNAVLTTADTVNIGAATIGTGGIGTSLLVQGNARITGILTIGTGSITLDGVNNTITGVTQSNLSNTNITGIATFTNGPVLIGSGTSTGTASQPLQVTGGAYVSGYFGIGSTNPQRKLDVSGDATTIDNNATIRVLTTNTTGYGAALTLNATSITSGRSYILKSSGNSDSAGVGKFAINDASANIDRLVIDSSGNLGIGSTTPARKLDVVDSGASGSVIRSRVTTNNGGYLAYEALNSSGTSVFSVTHNGRINLSENVVFASGQGLDFSATANSSGTMTSELLSDYEEGTWTPVDADGDAYTTSKLSTYTRVGRLVWAMCDVSATSTANGSKIGGLPFTAFGQSGTSFAGNYPCFNGYTSGPDARMNGHINSGTTQITLFVGGTETSLTNGQRIIITALYLA